QDETEARRLRISTERHSPWSALDGFQLGPPRRQSIEVVVEGAKTSVEVCWERSGPKVELPGGNDNPPTRFGRLTAVDDGDRVFVLHNLQQTEVAWPV